MVLEELYGKWVATYSRNNGKDIFIVPYHLSFFKQCEAQTYVDKYATIPFGGTIVRKGLHQIGSQTKYVPLQEYEDLFYISGEIFDAS
jgi:hypothetical protein